MSEKKEYIERGAVDHILKDATDRAKRTTIKALSLRDQIVVGSIMVKVADIPAADVEPVVREGCEYHCDNVDDSPWECNKCEAAWTLESGNPFDNNMNYCSECGRPIRSIRFNEWYYNSDEDCGDREVVMTREEYGAATEPKGDATT